jgi:hypothetical protein
VWPDPGVWVVGVVLVKLVLSDAERGAEWIAAGGLLVWSRDGRSGGVVSFSVLVLRGVVG